MTKKTISIWTESKVKILLRTINKNDIELIRKWKNENKQYFFFNEIISSEQQQNWFNSYLQREKDFIFLIQIENTKVGCIGFRILADYVDIYNVILGLKDFSNKGIMSEALRIMCYFIKSVYNLKITAKVLTSNPAIKWYEKNGFQIVETFPSYYLIEFKNLEFNSIFYYQIDSNKTVKLET